MGKIIFFLTALLLFPVAALAQESGVTDGRYVVDLSSFAGVVAVIGAVVTQIAKVIPAIADKKWLKVIIALVVGIALAYIIWLFQLSSIVEGYTWWQVLIVGVLSGAGSMGLYDFVKVIYNSIFNK